MDRPTEPETGPTGPITPAPPPADPVQRWRLCFARDPVPAELVGSATIDAWQRALADSGLPVAGREAGGAGHARFVLGAPLPAASAGRAELADIWLLERRPAWAVREALEDLMPPGHRYRGAENVWLGAPPLPGQVVAAVWTVTLDEPVAGTAALEAGCRALLEAGTLPRVRARASGDRAYDLRPLLSDVAVGDPDEDRRATLRLTTRLDPALGSGRPDEVVAALGDRIGRALGIARIVREQLVLAEPRIEPPLPAISPGRRRRR